MTDETKPDGVVESTEETPVEEVAHFHTSPDEEWRKALQADLETADDSDLVGKIDDAPQVADDRKETVAVARFLQFPALAGQPATEVTERTAESKGSSPSRFFHHTQTLLRAEYDEATFEHGPNFGATRQVMLTNGLRPVGDVTFAGTELAKDGKSIVLKYTAEAVPAIIATAPAVALVQVPQVKAAVTDAETPPAE
jgi:hypothetical protein